MKRSFSAILVAFISGICAVGVGRHALAQSAPDSIRPSVDANGVELRTGVVRFATLDLSIGQPGAGGLTLERTLEGWGGYTSYRAVIGKQASVGGSSGYTPYSVLIGQDGETYKKSNSSSTSLFVSDQGTPNSLTRTPANSSTPTSYTYTTADGVAYLFLRSINSVGAIPAEAYLSTVTLPTGEVRTYNYLSVLACNNVACSSKITVRRLQSITNNFGYQIKFIYYDNTPPPLPYGMGGPGSFWYASVGAKAINMSVDYCDPLAPDCTSTTQSWPSISYTGDSYGYNAVKDGTGKNVYSYAYGINGTPSLSIRLRDSSSDDIYYALGPSGPVSAVTRGGRTWTYTYSSTATEGTTTVTDPAGRNSVYVFDYVTGSMKSFTNTAGETTSYSIDAFGRPLTVTLPSLQTIQYTYDSRGNTTQVRRTPYPAGSDLVWTANYDTTCSNLKKCNKPNWTRDPALNQTTYTYHASTGQVATVTRPVVNGIAPVTTNTYAQLYAFYKTTAGGSPVQAATPAWFLTRSAECKTTVGCSTTSADQIRTDIDYGPGTAGVANNRLPVSSTLRSGDAASLIATATYGYDSIGNTTSVDGPLPGTVDMTVLRYDAQRRVVGKASPDPDGAGPRQNIGVRTTFDSRGLPVSQEVGNLPGQSDSAWSSFSPTITTGSDFDAEGRIIKQSVSAGGAVQQVSQISYDAAGRVECQAIRMNPAAFGSLPGACTASSAGNFGPDRIQHFAYDAGDRLTEAISGYGQADSITQTTTYTSLGVSTQSDGKGNKTTYRYDNYGRLSRIEYPDASNPGVSNSLDYEEFGYDVNSNVVSTRRRSGDVIQTPRDAWGRVTVKDLPGGTAEDVYYSYNNQSQMTSALYNNVAGSGIGQTFDSLGRVAKRTVFGKELSYQYDLAGRRTELGYPDSPSFAISYDYTNLDELQVIRNGATALATFSFDNLGATTALTRGNTTSTSYVPDVLRRLQQLTLDVSGTAFDSTTTFAYNPVGQITSKSQSNDAAYTWTPSAPNSTVSSQFDGRNRLTQFNGATVGYFDVSGVGNGDVRSGINNLTYTYDVLGQLRGATGGPSVVTIDYDPAGMLRRVTNGSTVTDYLYDGGDLIAEYVDNVLTRRYVHAPGSDAPLVTYDGTGLNTQTYLYADERGSVVTAANSAGVASASAKFGSYGESTSLVSGFGYTGQRYIPELQLYYYKARMYSPETGRFVQPDPAGYADGLNLYGYVGGDPVNKVDPTGLETCWVQAFDIPGAFSADDPREITAHGYRVGYQNVCIDTPDSGNSGAGGGGDGGGGGGSPSQTLNQCLAAMDKPGEISFPLFMLAAGDSVLAMATFAADTMGGATRGSAFLRYGNVGDKSWTYATRVAAGQASSVLAKSVAPFIGGLGFFVSAAASMPAVSNGFDRGPGAGSLQAGFALTDAMLTKALSSTGLGVGVALAYNWTGGVQGMKDRSVRTAGTFGCLAQHGIPKVPN